MDFRRGVAGTQNRSRVVQCGIQVQTRSACENKK
jgi:hypothetical protein